MESSSWIERTFSGENVIFATRLIFPCCFRSLRNWVAYRQNAHAPLLWEGAHDFAFLGDVVIAAFSRDHRRSLSLFFISLVELAPSLCTLSSRSRVSNQDVRFDCQ
jgi:hypothetical protein